MYYLNPSLIYYIPLAAAVAALFVYLNYLRKNAVQRAFGDEQLLNEVSNPLSKARYLTRGILASLAAAALLAALVRPVVQDGSKSIAQGTVDVMAVVDVSRSMAAMDFEGKVPQSAVARRLIDNGEEKVRTEDTGTRLEMVRHIMLDHLLPALSTNQLGIVSYAGEAFPQAFLTKDTSALRWVVDRGLTVSSAPGEGSDIAKALELAIAMFDADSAEGRERILILFSDGGNTSEDASKFQQFFKDIKERNIQLFVVGLGNVMPSKIPVSKLASDDDYARSLLEHGKRWYEVNGEIERSGLDIAFLQALANKAGTKLIHLQKAEDLSMFSLVGKTSMVNVPGTQELFPWLIAFALVMLILSFAAAHELKKRSQS